MLFEHLERLGPEDLLLLDRGYPCRWLVASLNQRGISFCMRVELGGESGFTCVRQFRRSGLSEQIVPCLRPSAATSSTTTVRPHHRGCAWSVMWPPTAKYGC